MLGDFFAAGGQVILITPLLKDFFLNSLAQIFLQIQLRFGNSMGASSSSHAIQKISDLMTTHGSIQELEHDCPENAGKIMHDAVQFLGVFPVHRLFFSVME